MTEEEYHKILGVKRISPDNYIVDIVDGEETLINTGESKPVFIEDIPFYWYKVKGTKKYKLFDAVTGTFIEYAPKSKKKCLKVTEQKLKDIGFDKAISILFDTIEEYNITPSFKKNGDDIVTIPIKLHISYFSDKNIRSITWNGVDVRDILSNIDYESIDLVLKNL